MVPDPETMHEINVTGTQAIIAAAGGGKNALFIQQGGNFRFKTARSPPERPPKLRNTTFQIKQTFKYQAEQMVKQLTDDHHLPSDR